jgi:hypothetical protein
MVRSFQFQAVQVFEDYQRFRPDAASCAERAANLLAADILRAATLPKRGSTFSPVPCQGAHAR